MITQAGRRAVLPLAVGLAAAWLTARGLSPAQAGVAPSVQRPDDPVVLSGASFPALAGAPLDDLHLYAYRAGAWAPLPFQIDEVNISGTYVISDGGLLDNNDELVFMFGDAGQAVSPTVWPDDAASRLQVRYAISVTDPLNAADAGWVYLYRSTTLTRSGVSYVGWDHARQTATAVSYTAAFSPTRFGGLANLAINGNPVDVLDRQKIRISLLGGLIQFNEETLLALGPATVTLPAVGPVRAAARDDASQTAFFGSRMDFDASLDLSGLGGLVNFMRTSFDWNDPITTGLTTYFDSNTPGGAPIDGAPDAVPTTPRLTWFQVSGAPGGVVVVASQIGSAGGTATSYYKDDGAIDNNDTGDRRSFADAGVRVDNPGMTITSRLVAYILPPGVTSAVGAAYLARVNNPLVGAAAEQAPPTPVRDKFIYLPLVLRNYP